MNLLLVINPGSRAGRSLNRHRFWLAELAARGVPHRVVQTAAVGDAAEAARNPGTADTVVAVGGDGTINEVCHGILTSGRPDLAMGVLYAGTSPDFCRFHGIPTDPKDALEALLAGTAARVDAARLACRDKHGNAVAAHFACGCNIGLGAAVARTANRLRPYCGDIPGTAAATLNAICRARPLNLVAQTDTETIALPRTNHLAVLKNPHIASGLRLDVGLRPNDGDLALVAIRERSPWGLARLLPGFYNGRAVHAPGVTITRCRSVTVTAAAPALPIELEFDGDPGGFLPATAEVLPRALQLIGGSHDGT